MTLREDGTREHGRGEVTAPDQGHQCLDNNIERRAMESDESRLTHGDAIRARGLELIIQRQDPTPRAPPCPIIQGVAKSYPGSAFPVIFIR